METDTAYIIKIPTLAATVHVSTGNTKIETNIDASRHIMRDIILSSATTFT